jgi:hypothetical protein
MAIIQGFAIPSEARSSPFFANPLANASMQTQIFDSRFADYFLCLLHHIGRVFVRRSLGNQANVNDGKHRIPSAGSQKLALTSL